MPGGRIRPNTNVCSHTFVHATETRLQALELAAAGVNDCEISRRLGVPRATVRDWRAPRYVPAKRSLCPRCWKWCRPIVMSSDDYAELLGLYLGDGCISRLGRTYSFRLSLDAAHPGVLSRSADLLRRCFPANPLTEVRVRGSGAVVLCVYSAHAPCLFPQHGPGKKHTRRITLEPWQQALVDEAPWAFLRGLINSDGCYFVNVTGRYAYPSYGFSNHSPDILDLFAATCDKVGIEYRRYERSIRVNRRASVTRLEQRVGRKG